MSSVLTILSKSTASTQYPDINDVPVNKKPKPRRQNLYKSRILNQHTLEDDFVILQSKKEINQSSSNYSELTNLGRPEVQKSREENSVINQVLEGKKLNKNEPRIETGENDKKVYNLFVDLLETTINMYNAETERDKSNNLNTILEINQDVAEKLEINTKYNESHHSLLKNCLKNKLSEIAIYRDSGTNIVDEEIPIFPKIKAKSFIQNKKATNIPKSKSFEPKSSNVKSKKKNLLNILKEQIQIGSAVEEPRNLYEALKIMAKNKQRSEKSIKFNEPDMLVDNGRKDPECTFKRRNLFTKSKRKRNINKVIQKYTHFDKVRIKKDETKILKTIPSYKSVEVYGFNYEEKDNREFKEENELRRLREEIEKRKVMFTYHPPSPMISDLDYCALLKYPDTSASYCAIQQFGNYEIQ